MNKTLNITTAKIIWSPTIILGFFLVLFFIIQIGSFYREQYLIKEYENNLNLLSKRIKELEINLSKIDSLANIENHLLSRNFVKPEQIKYIRILESSVVSK